MNTAADSSPAESIDIQHDIAFLGPGRAEKLDAYLPPERFARPVPAVLLIHGGGWRVCDKADAREVNIATQLAEAGYAVFSINYLLNEGEKDAEGKVQITKVAWPQNFLDCKSGLRFLRQEAGRFGIDPARIATMGGSAGGTLALLLATTEHIDEMNTGGLYTEQSNAVSCVIDFYGPPDVRANRWHDFGGATEAETRDNVRKASPLCWLHHRMPPVLIAHGTADTIVPVEDSRALSRKLQELGVDYWYVEIAGAPHTFHLQPEQMDLAPVVLTFLKKHLGAPDER